MEVSEMEERKIGTDQRGIKAATEAMRLLLLWHMSQMREVVS